MNAGIIYGIDNGCFFKRFVKDMYDTVLKTQTPFLRAFVFLVIDDDKFQ